MKKKEETTIEGPVVTVTEQRTEVIAVKRIRRRPVYQNSRLSFCPYVRMNNSRDFSSWCAVVNKPQDAVVFQRRRKKGILRMRNPFSVAKGVPHTAAMLPGPMINKELSGRCLTCSLCGKMANYKDLGDLCGPYYAEDGFPRKILTTVGQTEPFREDKTNSSSSDSKNEKADPPLSTKGENDGEKTEKTQEGSSSSSSSSSRHHHHRYRRAERTERSGRDGGGPRRLTLRERFRKMKQLREERGGVSSSEAAGEQEANDSLFQRLQAEAEAKEHWAHENCAIWTKGIVMVAGRLYGLKEASKNSAETSCYKCQNVGASLSCCWRGCSHKYHYVCAKEIGCTFHEDDFSIKCPKHEDL